MRSEVWKQLGKWPYEVSSHGKVCHAETEELCKLNPDKDGYLRVSLNYRGEYRQARVHVLVCLLFNGPKPFKDAQVRHLDGTVDNNYYKNLRWGTSLENHDDRRRHGHDRHGEKNQAALFTNAQVEEMRKLYATGKYKQWDLAKIYGTKQGVISGILRGKTYNADGVVTGNFTQRGESQYNAVFTEKDIRDIRAFYASGEYTQYTLGSMYGVLQATINKIVLRKTWKHII